MSCPKRMSKYGPKRIPPGEIDTRWCGSNRAKQTALKPRNGTHPNRGHSTFWDLPTHWGRSQRGAWVVKQEAPRTPRLEARVFSAIGMATGKNLHVPIKEQHQEAHGKAEGPLRVPRDYWKLFQPPAIFGRSAKDLATCKLTRRYRRDGDAGDSGQNSLQSGEALQTSPSTSRGSTRPAQELRVAKA